MKCVPLGKTSMVYKREPWDVETGRNRLVYVRDRTASKSQAYPPI